MISPIKRMTSAFTSAGDRSSRFPGGDMPLQNLKSLYVESPDLPIFTRAVSPCPLQLPPAKPPPPGLLPLLHPCNKVDAVRVGHKLKKEVTSHSRVLDLGDEFLDLFAYMLGFLRVLHFECSYVRHHLFKVSSRNGVQLL